MSYAKKDLKNVTASIIGVVVAAGHVGRARLQRRLAAEVVVEYIPGGGDSKSLRIGTRVPGATVRGIGLDRAPQ